MLSQMIATAATNPIKIAMGMATGGAGAAAAPGMPGMPAGGPLGGIMGGVSGLMGGIGTGFGSVVSGLMSGGLGGAASAIGTAVSGATTGLAGLGTAIGAIAAPLAAVGLIFAAFRSKTKLLDSGIRATVTGMDTLVETFKKVEKSRFFGLSKSTSKRYSGADAALADPISGAVTQILTGIGDGVSALGLDRKKMGDLAYDFEISTKGKSDAEIQAAIEEQLGGLSDAAVRAVAGTALDRFQRAEETLGATLERMVGNLTGVNDIMDQLQAKALTASVSGAAAATAMAEAAGGLQGLASAASTFMAEFWTEGERMESATSRVSDALAKIGVAMPKTRAEFRAVVDAIDTTTEAGATLYGQMLSLSGSFAAVVPTLGLLTPALDDLRTSLISQVDAMIGQVTEAQNEEVRAAREWKQAADRIRGFVRDMKMTVGAGRTGSQARGAAEAEYQILLARVAAGDRAAMSEITGVASNLVSLAGDQARTQLEAAAVQGRVMGDLQGIATLADVEAERHAIISAILGEQVTKLTEVRDILARGDELTAAKVAELQGIVTGVGTTIAAADGASLGVLRGMAQTLPGGLAGALKGVFGEDISGVNSGIAGLRLALAKPLATLGAGLGQLRYGLADSANRVVSAIERQAAQNAITAAEAKRAAGIEGVQGIIGKIRELEASTGAKIVNAKGLASNLNVGPNGFYSNGPLAGVTGTADAIKAFGAAFWGPGGLQEQMLKGSKAVQGESAKINTLRAQAARYPAAQAAKAPAAGQSNAEMVAEMKAMRNENRQLLMAVVKHTRTTAKFNQKADAIGLPETRSLPA